ncbi:hypothetical protein HYT05_05075 [Candidatus Kaiserbacteria bacterium]|nr:hypothetical protein [Candidatus Kaiserbacteria bacterium]
MPCDIGFKSYAKITIPVPTPQTFSARFEAPNIDTDLLEKLGVEDPEFLAWAKELDQRPLLEEALKRALAKMDAGGIDFIVNADGMLEAKGSFTTTSEKKWLSEKASAVSDRWQFEILGIVTQLLDYTVNITQKGDELILEAEEAGRTHPCDYIKITRKGDISDIRFEHFKSRGALDLAMAKFLTLAHKLGVKIELKKCEISEGSPFPGEIRIDHGLRHSHGGHEHEH